MKSTKNTIKYLYNLKQQNKLQTNQNYHLVKFKTLYKAQTIENLN